MGAVEPVSPEAGLNEFGEPQLGADQVLVLPSGLTFHIGFCQEVVRIADQGLSRLIVTQRAAVGRRRMCAFCRDEGPVR